MAASAPARYHDRLKKKRQAINVHRRQIGMADTDYRALLRRVAGVASSADLMTQDAADAVLAELQRHGAPAPVKRPAGVNEWRFVFKLTGERQALAKKIYRCAEKIGLAQTPPVPVMSKAWVEGIVKQAGGFNAPGVAGKVASPLETCSADALTRVVKILESWARKIGA